MSVNIVIPMAGAGSRFASAGYQKPKPFIDVLGKPMISHVLDNLQYKNGKYILIAQEAHLEREKSLVKQIESEYNAIFHPISHITEGAACTVLHARKYINNDDSLVIANSDQIVDIVFHRFVDDCLNRNLGGSIMTFIDPESNPKWSFAKTNESGLVVEVREKLPISNTATVGIYMFNHGKDFVDGAIDMIVQNDRVNNEFYVCPVYNYATKNKLDVGIYDVSYSAMHGLGTPEDLDKYLKFLKP
jgi:UDP-N-acetylglucosamine diphosphorylase / glucose-1-phosphate thymidylyltransferase / UDP-N-acetylgalactosamine diphosphorylase / glucosamine-1-phosphate N-acetyltransferase / galactosamine-1-phosphate N-acetyltransferase